jgi:hypothetical protein
LKSQDYSKLTEHGILVDKITPERRNQPDSYVVSWGDIAHQTKGCAIETGFFWDAVHMDSIGLYEKASFNFPDARDIIYKFEAPTSYRELLNAGKIRTKFRQPETVAAWHGVVVIAQHPGDRSIWKVGSTWNYHQWLESVCRHFGKHAFVKIHPVTLGNKEELQIISEIAQKYGSLIGHVSPQIMEHCEAVLVYNSTFVVDAISAGKHVLQYAPGYFWQSGVVQYTSGHHVPIKLCCPVLREKMLDFLVWKYCFHKLMPMEKIAEMIRAFATSNDFFPLPTELSYAAHILA